MRYIFLSFLILLGSCTLQGDNNTPQNPVSSGNTGEIQNKEAGQDPETSSGGQIASSGGEVTGSGGQIASSGGEVTGSGGQITNSGGEVKNPKRTEDTTGKYCLLDMCIPNALEITKKDGIYTARDIISQNPETPEGELDPDAEYIEYKYDPMKKIFTTEHTDVFLLETTKIFPVKNGYIKTQYSGGCGGGHITQELFSKNGEKTKTLDGLEKKPITVGSITYTPTFSFQKADIGLATDATEKTQLFNDIIFRHEEAFSSQLHDDVKSKHFLFKHYGVQFTDNPDVYVLYTTDDIDFDRFLFFYTPNQEIENKVYNGKVTDQSVTTDIIKQYNDNNFGAFIFREEGNDDKTMIDDENIPTESMLRVQRLYNGYGPFMVFLDDKKYHTYVLAEMCKPVVYYYGDENKENTLTLIPKNGDFFTKLIPEFTSKNTWNFMAQNDRILVKDQNYDYLYYSLATVDYTHNENGWIVRGEDAVRFFEDKLPKIGFNSREKQDFIDYWKDKYRAGKYYFVSFKYTDELEKIITLDFGSQPKQMFRVLLDSYELESFSKSHKKYLYTQENLDILDTYLIKKFERDPSKSAVFEWGGVLQTKEKRFVR
ncbi:hypothetical protein CSB09_00015 [Candidatus Gracilibacteria bacterium]|nr:MAG: hypothetical protein CSB09_00015 [Candidatus Gracilibacteria bacterium]